MATRILLIEDEPMLSSLYTLMLTKSGYDVTSALDAETGQEQIVVTRPHLILLDLLIPTKPNGDRHGENIHEPIGFMILRLVKNTPSLSMTRVIILSNLDSDEHIRTAKKLGADRYLVKSNLDPHDLKKEVEDVLHSPEVKRKK